MATQKLQTLCAAQSVRSKTTGIKAEFTRRLSAARASRAAITEQ